MVKWCLELRWRKFFRKIEKKLPFRGIKIGSFDTTCVEELFKEDTNEKISLTFSAGCPQPASRVRGMGLFSNTAAVTSHLHRFFGRSLCPNRLL